MYVCVPQSMSHVCVIKCVCYCDCRVFLKVSRPTEVRLSSGGDTRHSDKSIMWSCFTVGGGELNKACERDKVRVCACACACSPAVQMFPIFNSPLAPLDVQESMSLCRTYVHVPHTDCSYIVQPNSSHHWSSFLVPHDTAVVPH